MCATFTDDDIGKSVINENGDEIGMISAVESGTARVDPDPGMTDTIKAALEWGDAGDETFPLDPEAVESFSDDEVLLRSSPEHSGGVNLEDEGATHDQEMGTDTEPGMDAETGEGTEAEARMDLGDAEIDRGMEVDPSDVAQRDPDTGVSMGEESEIGERSDAEINPDDMGERTDAEVDIGDSSERGGESGRDRDHGHDRDLLEDENDEDEDDDEDDELL